MINKKNLTKILWLFSALSIILPLFAIYGVQYNSLNMSTMPTFTISLLNPIYQLIEANCSANLSGLICNILTINIAFYAFIVLPFALFNWISDILHFGGKK